MRVPTEHIPHYIRQYIKKTNSYPTVRELADFIGIHWTTVQRKIKILKQQGVLVTKPRGGSGISFPAPEPKQENE